MLSTIDSEHPNPKNDDRALEVMKSSHIKDPTTGTRCHQVIRFGFQQWKRTKDHGDWDSGYFLPRSQVYFRLR